MHAYFPALNSYPSLLGDMLADAIGCLGFTWVSNVCLCVFCFQPSRVPNVSRIRHVRVGLRVQAVL